MKKKGYGLDVAIKKVKKAGRKGDTELVHVNPHEKKILKGLGGSGTKNPKTGLREYFLTPEQENRLDFDARMNDPGLHLGLPSGFQKHG